MNHLVFIHPYGRNLDYRPNIIFSRDVHCTRTPFNKSKSLTRHTASTRMQTLIHCHAYFDLLQISAVRKMRTGAFVVCRSVRCFINRRVLEGFPNPTLLFSGVALEIKQLVPIERSFILSWGVRICESFINQAFVDTEISSALFSNEHVSQQSIVVVFSVNQ